MGRNLNQKEVQQRVRRLIKESGLTDSAFAKKVGVDPSNFSRKLLGTQTWTVNDVKKICDTINVSHEWLVDGIGDIYEEKHSLDGDNVIPNITDVIQDIPVDGNKESYLDVVMTLFKRYMDNEQRYQEIIKENQKIMQQITFIYEKIKEG